MFPSPSEHDSKQVLLKVLVEVVQLGLVNQESPGDQKALREKKTLKFGYILYSSLDLFSYALEYFFKMITDKSTNSTKKNLLYSKLAKLISFFCTFGFFSLQNLTSSLFVPMMVGTCAKSPSLSMSSGSLGTKSLSTAGCQWMGNIPDTVVSISWASVISLASAWQRGEKAKDSVKLQCDVPRNAVMGRSFSYKPSIDIANEFKTLKLELSKLKNSRAQITFLPHISVTFPLLAHVSGNISFILLYFISPPADIP